MLKYFISSLIKFKIKLIYVLYHVTVSREESGFLNYIGHMGDFTEQEMIWSIYLPIAVN